METSETESRLSSLERRLIVIEARLGIVSVPKQPHLQKTATPGRSTPSPTLASSNDVDGKPGTWLGFVAVLCFICAAGFIIKLSIDTGWLTPLRQAGLASLLGAGLIGTGLMLLNSDRAYASYLPGAGVVVLFMTAFAAHRYYHLLSFEEALGLVVIVAALCIWLYTRILNEVYPITAAIGTYVAPLVLGLNAEADFALYYYLVCSVGFAVISIGLQSRILTLVAAYLALGITTVTGFDIADHTLVACALAGHFVIFTTGTYLYTRHTNVALTETEAWGFLPVLLFFYAVEYHFVNLITPAYAPWISLTFATFLLGLYCAAKATLRDELNSLAVILAFATVVVFHSVYLELLPAEAKPWLFILIVVPFAFLPARLTEGRIAPVYWLPILALATILIIEYLTILFHLTDHFNTEARVQGSAAVVALWMLLLRPDRVYLKREGLNYLLLGAAHVLAILLLYRLTTDISSLAVSASWLLYAVVVMFLSFLRKEEVMAKSALFILGFAAGKALLYDAASAPTTIRIFCLLLTGAVLYGCGYFMRRISLWQKT